MRLRPFLIPLLVSTVWSTLELNAQVLFVNDNDNITYNSDTVLNDLAATGLAFDTYDIPVMGVPPDAALVSSYPFIIWYCSGDGADLGFWDSSVQTNLVDHVLAGNTLWVIGTDVLYAQYGGAPVTFGSGDFPLDMMGISTYDLQSYGDDGGLGCPQMDVATGVAAFFEPTLLWQFSALWWADGCTPALGAEPIYAMGPSSYLFFGAQSMIHYHPAGTNVMSTFFDPALIDSYENRVLFFGQTLDYLGVGASVGPDPSSDEVTLSVLPSGNHGAVVTCSAAMLQIDVHNVRGQLLNSTRGFNSRRIELRLSELAEGLHLITATTAGGRRVTRKWVGL